jgi:hypothetical protein
VLRGLVEFAYKGKVCRVYLYKLWEKGFKVGNLAELAYDLISVADRYQIDELKVSNF